MLCETVLRGMAGQRFSGNHFLAHLAMAIFTPDNVVSILRDDLLRKLRVRPHCDSAQREIHHLVDSIARLIYRGFLLSGNAQASLKDILFGLQRYNFPRSETLGLALKAFLEALALSKAESGALRFYLKSLVLTRPVFALEYFLFHANESRTLIREDWDYLFPNHEEPRNPSLRFGEYLLAHRLFFTEDGVQSPERLNTILRYGVTDVLPLTTSTTRVPRYGRAQVHENILLDLLATLLTCLNDCCNERAFEITKCIRLVLKVLPPGITMEMLYARSVTCRFTNAGIPKDRINKPVKKLQDSGHFPELRARLGLDVMDLKHMCKCVIRKQLFINWALPDGIEVLELPRELKDYIELVS